MRLQRMVVSARLSLLIALAGSGLSSGFGLDSSLNKPQAPISLEAVLPSEFTRLAHPAFPDHAVRIARARDFCDSSVGVYTGYVDVGSRHLFFYFFESRRDPDKDDVVMWINGGPGGSATLGMLMAHGPCNIAGPNSTAFNPHSLNAQANSLFLDQPIGTGFSYSDDERVVGTSEQAAEDIAAFFAILSASFSQFRGRPLHLAGESYAGKFIPLIGAAIYDQNERLRPAGVEPINLRSVILGNALVDVYSVVGSYQEMQCTNASGLAPVQSISTCVHMKQASARCLDSMVKFCQETLDYMDCNAAFMFCATELYLPLRGIASSWDLSDPCTREAPSCYPQLAHITTFLNDPHTRARLHTDALPRAFAPVSAPVYAAFSASGDWHRTAVPWLGALLDRGVRALVFNGVHDFECSWLAGERTTRRLDWAGKAAFAQAEMREWEVGGRKAGKTRTYGGLTFASVFEAGHMVPHDQPAVAAAMIQRWLGEEPL